MNYETKNLMLFEEVDANLKRIIDRYGLNENLFSRETSSTFDNVLQAQRMVYQNTIIPESNDDAKALSDYLGVTEEGEFLMLDYSHLSILKDDEVKKSQILERKTRAFAILVLQEDIDTDTALEMVGLERAEVEEV